MGVIVLLVYVDDIIVAGDDWNEQRILSQHSTNEPAMKTLEMLKYFFGS